MTDLARLYAALATPYTDRDTVSEPCLRKLIRFVQRQGIDGLYVGGSTGEALLQTPAEREQVLRTVADECGGAAKIIGHVGALSTRESTSLARVCREAGYDAISAIPPIYFPQTKQSIKQYYQAIIEAAAGVPLIIYNVPAMSGVTFSVAELGDFLAMDGVAGIKQTTVDMYQMERLRRLNPDAVLLNGYDEVFLAGIVSGANGGVGSTYNIMGQRYSQIWRAVLEGDTAAAFKLQSRCNAVIDLLVEAGVFPGIKFILHAMGVIATPHCRAPLSPVNGTFGDSLSRVADTLLAEIEQ